MNYTADRGGPVVQTQGPARNWMRAAAPGIAFRFPLDESSPIGGGERAPRAQPCAAPGLGRTAIALCIALLAIGGTASFGRGVYIYAKAELAQVLLHAAWNRARETGVAARPWPWADTHPVARLTAPAQDADVLVLAGASGRTLAFGPGHLDGSAQPGDPGNAVITAHRDTHFRFLRLVAPGDAGHLLSVRRAQSRRSAALRRRGGSRLEISVRRAAACAACSRCPRHRRSDWAPWAAAAVRSRRARARRRDAHAGRPHRPCRAASCRST